MQALLIWLARIAGVIGVVLIGVAAIARLSGAYWFGGFQSGTWLQAGMAAAVLGCLAYVSALVERTKA